jgi:hypothetical protein
MAHTGGNRVLSLPIHGFAKHVEDTVLRQMTVHRAWDELMATRHLQNPRVRARAAGRNSV